MRAETPVQTVVQLTLEFHPGNLIMGGFQINQWKLKDGFGLLFKLLWSKKPSPVYERSRRPSIHQSYILIFYFYSSCKIIHNCLIIIWKLEKHKTLAHFLHRRRYGGLPTNGCFFIHIRRYAEEKVAKISTHPPVSSWFWDLTGTWNSFAFGVIVLKHKICKT